MEMAKGNKRSGSQRTVLQTVLPIFILIGLVAGTTFVYQLTNRDATTPVEEHPTVPQVRLTFPETSLDTVTDYILYSTGHLDFWFANPQPTAMEVGLVRTNCDCTGVQVGILAPDGMADAADWPRFQAWVGRTRSAVVGLAATGLPQALVGALATEQATHAQLTDRLRWQALLPEKPPNPGQSATVPPGAVGVMRVHFEAKKELKQPDHLKAELWTRTAGTQETVTRGPELTVILRFVPAIQLEPETVVIDVGTVEGDRPTPPRRLFACWSSTLSRFRLEAHSEDPCVQVTCQPLSAEQMRILESVLQRRKIEAPVRSGYSVEAVVYGRYGKSQLDLGPFYRHIQLDGDVPSRGRERLPEITITGVVHGDVQVSSPSPEPGGERKQDYIALGNFRAVRGKSVTATVEANPGVELVPDAVQLDPKEKLEGIVKARLVRQQNAAGERPTWDLEVTVLPDRLHGPLPPHSAILLKVKGDPPRGLRVPINGSGFTELRRR